MMVGGTHYFFPFILQGSVSNLSPLLGYLWAFFEEKKVEKVSEMGKMFIVFHSSIRKDVLDKKLFLSDFSKIHVESSASNKFSTEFELLNSAEHEPHIHYSSLLLFSIQFF